MKFLRSRTTFASVDLSFAKQCGSAITKSSLFIQLLATAPTWNIKIFLDDLQRPVKMSSSNEPEAQKGNVADSKVETKPLQPQKPAAQLEEDDEFEDFPVEGKMYCAIAAMVRLMSESDWAKEEEVGAQGPTTHLWEESWDDDDTSDDFSVQLKEELKKMESQRKG